MNALAIRTIEISGSGFLNGLAPEAFVDRLADRLAMSVDRATGGAVEGYSHYVCSSTLDISCSAGWFDPAAVCRRVREATGVRCSYSNAMQCATWGFLVRQHLANKPDVRHILCSIVDANPLGMRFWEDNVSWGRTGHRITFVHLEIPSVPDRDLATDLDAGAPPRPVDAIVIGKCNPEAMLYDYAIEIQKVMARWQDHTIAIPYFEEKMRKGLKRSMAGHAHLPDLYEEYGHLCGSDPWMSIARDDARVVAGPGGKHYLASSIASEGYFCFLSATADAQSRISIEGAA